RSDTNGPRPNVESPLVLSPESRVLSPAVLSPAVLCYNRPVATGAKEVESTTGKRHESPPRAWAPNLIRTEVAHESADRRHIDLTRDHRLPRRPRRRRRSPPGSGRQHSQGARRPALAPQAHRQRELRIARRPSRDGQLAQR